MSQRDVRFPTGACLYEQHHSIQPAFVEWFSVRSGSGKQGRWIPETDLLLRFALAFKEPRVGILKPPATDLRGCGRRDGLYRRSNITLLEGICP